MAFPPSSTRRQDVRPRDSPPPTSQGGSSNGPKADVARKTKEVNHLLAKLEKEGMKIDGKVASIIDDGIARIKAEAAREDINEPNRNLMESLLILATVAVGFALGVEWRENSFRKEYAKMRRA